VVWNADTKSDMLVGEGRVILECGVAAAGLAERPWDDFARGVHYLPEDICVGGFDPNARMVDMARHGIDVSVLFPTMGLAMGALRDRELAADHCRVENDWMAGHCNEQPGRLYGVATLPMQDVDLAIEEAKRAVGQLGLRGVMVRPNPYGPHHLHHEMYDPFWATIQDLDVPVCLHPGGSEEMWGFSNLFREHPIAPALGFGFALAFGFDAQFTWSLLVGGGVLDRFPRLRVAIMETGGGWMANWLVRMDHVNEVYEWAEPHLALRPSDYFRRQGWISFDPDEATLAATADIVGHDRIVWASDYPHQDLRCSCVRTELDENLRGLPLASRRMIQSENARRLYGL
jgi:predicted TIM-barrel fold metal-dependent hydrolase